MSEISKTIQIICAEKNLSYDTVLEAIEIALAAAYRKDFGNRQQNIKMKFDADTGDMKAWDIKEIVADIAPEALEAAQNELIERRERAKYEDRELTEEEIADLPRFNPKTQLMLSEAQKIKKDVQIGEILEIVLEIPGEFGRMAAQTAKQVIIQKLREAERTTVLEDFKTQEGQIVQGIVQKRDRTGLVIVDLGKISGVLPTEEQIQTEMYRPGTRMRFFVVSANQGERGPEIVLSRSNENMIKTVFQAEIPEIGDGTVQIKGIARDPGHRAKVAVFTSDESIDPIGACIGQRGSRITTIIEQLGGEKIDIIQFSESPKDYIKHALSPAKVSAIELSEADKQASVKVPADQFSLAIGRGGQNVKLASQLTGWNINVVQEDVVPEETEAEVADNTEESAVEAKEEIKEAVEAPEATEEKTEKKEIKKKKKKE